MSAIYSVNKRILFITDPFVNTYRMSAYRAAHCSVNYCEILWTYKVTDNTLKWMRLTADMAMNPGGSL